MLGKFHISLSNRLLHLATTKLAIVLYFGYTVNTFWLGSGRLPVKLNYNECQEHITISFSKHEAQFSGKQPYAMFSHTPSATQRAEFSCCWRKKILKRQSTDLLLWVKKNPEFVSVFKFTDRESGKILICMKGFLEKGNSISGDRGQQGCDASVLAGPGGFDSMAMHIFQICKNHQTLLETSRLPVWGGVSEWSKTPLRIWKFILERILAF